MTRTKAWLITATMAAALTGSAIALIGPYNDYAAESWRDKLAAVPEDKAEALLEQISRLGDSGIPVLVDSLGSNRECVASAAAKIIRERIHVWQEARHLGQSPKLARLAECLAERIDSFGPTARTDAADLATKMLLWPPDYSAVERARMIAACEKVIRAAPEIDRLAARADSVARDLLTDSENIVDDPLEQLAHIPGGGLDVGLTDSPVAVLPSPSENGAAGTTEPEREPPRLLEIPENEESKPLEETSSEEEIAPHPASYQTPSPAEKLANLRDDQSSELTTLETPELMRRYSAGGRDGSLAEAELARRGFKTVHFELAKLLFDPDPQARQKLARTLPSLTAVDPAPWLMWLAKDEDADVRLTAIGLLITTGDPNLLAKLERLSLADSDPRIRQQGKRLAAMRGSRR